MRLEPIAKPIRIRIKLGKNEYSNLSEVKNNFSVEELFPLYLDGRLERWLFQIGEADLANKVKTYVESNDNQQIIGNYIRLISIFFEEVSETLSHLEFPKCYNDNNSFLRSLPFETLKIIYQYTNDLDVLDWKELLDPIITSDNIISFFSDPSFQRLYSVSNEWGMVFVKRVGDNETCKHFFDYISKFVSQHPDDKDLLTDYYYGCYNNGYDWVDVYSNAGLDTILQWYSNEYFKNISKFCWGDIIRPFLNIENLKALFESSKYNSIYSKQWWGHEFANYVNNTDDFKSIFTYLDENISEKDNRDFILNDFLAAMKSKGYTWQDSFKDEVTLDYLTKIYSKDQSILIDVDWGSLFANQVANWNVECSIIEKLLKTNSRHLITFYNTCANNGIVDAYRKMDPWFVLANSDDFDDVNRALTEWDGDRRHYDRENYNYYKIQSELGCQILDFLQSLIDLRGKDGCWENTKYDYNDNYYLQEEKSIMLEVKKRYSDSYSCLVFTVASKTILNDFARRGNILARHVLDHSYDSYMDIAKFAVDNIRKKILKRKD